MSELNNGRHVLSYHCLPTLAILDNNLHGNESSSAVTIMPTLDDILHGDNTRHVLAFIDYDDVIALLSVSRGFNSKRSQLTADDSLFIELQQYTPHALVEHLLGWMQRDLTGAYTVHSNGNHRSSWGFANWADIGGTRRFEMDLPSSAQGYRGRNRLQPLSILCRRRSPTIEYS